jgi:hypothetical protein
MNFNSFRVCIKKDFSETLFFCHCHSNDVKGVALEGNCCVILELSFFSGKLRRFYEKFSGKMLLALLE